MLFYAAICYKIIGKRGYKINLKQHDRILFPMPNPTIPPDRPVLGQDLNPFADRLNRTPAECCALLGISASTWSAWKKRGDQPIVSATVALAIRLYDRFPELAPRESTPEELLSLLNQVTGQTIPHTRLAALLGRERTSGYRWTQRGHPSLPVSRLIGAVQRLLLTRFTGGLHEYERLVLQEATARGMTDPLRDGSWVPEKTDENLEL